MTYDESRPHSSSFLFFVFVQDCLNGDVGFVVVQQRPAPLVLFVIGILDLKYPGIRNWKIESTFANLIF